jgi:hypothetical protein
MSGAQDAVTQGKPSALIRQSGGTPDGRMGIVACLSREDLFAQSIFRLYRETHGSELARTNRTRSQPQPVLRVYVTPSPVALPTMNDFYHDPAAHMQHSNYQPPDNAALRQVQKTS